MIAATEYDVRNGEAHVKYAGHVQFQPSENDLRNHPGLAPALGHRPVADRRLRETLPVQGTLSNGLPFAVSGVRAQPKNAGDDKPLDPARASHVIDHGDLTDEQAQRDLAAQDKPVLPHYETSRLEQANCVAAHVELTRRLLGQEIGPMPPHAMPQELAPLMAQVKTRPPTEWRCREPGPRGTTSGPPTRLRLAPPPGAKSTLPLWPDAPSARPRTPKETAPMESTAPPPHPKRREAPGPAADPPQVRSHEFTCTAFRALGLNALQADQAAAVGGAVLNGTLVSVAPLLVGSLTGQHTDDLYMVTAETGRRLAELSTRQVATMLAHGPGLLAVHQATLGCLPDGRIVLHRTVDAAGATPLDLANAMHTAQQLVQLLWGDSSNPAQQ